MSIKENGKGVQHVKHNKTGNIYLVLAHAILTTNAHDGEKVIIYCPYDGENTIYVRDEAEFYEKFTDIDD